MPFLLSTVLAHEGGASHFLAAGIEGVGGRLCREILGTCSIEKLHILRPYCDIAQILYCTLTSDASCGEFYNEH